MPDKQPPKYRSEPKEWAPRDPRQEQENAVAVFRKRLMSMKEPKVLEIGTRRTRPDNPTARKAWAPHAAEYVCADFRDGLDVDVIADAHDLTSVFQPGYFDAVIACSIFEHIQYPWVAAAEIAKILKPGGSVFISTHQTFPLHGHPHDYWRFTRDSLKSLFSSEVGFEESVSCYSYPCDIVSEQAPKAKDKFAFLLVSLTAIKGVPAKEWRLVPCTD